MAATPFESPEVIARFNAVQPWGTSSPTPRPKVPSMFSTAPSAWNVGGRAVSAGKCFASPRPALAGLAEDPTHPRFAPDGLWARYQNLKSHDQTKNEFIEDLFDQNQNLIDTVQSLKQELAQQHAINRQRQLREAQYLETIKKLDTCMNRNSFVLFLVNGDHITFNVGQMMRGEAGGRDTATMIHQSIQARLQSASESPDTETKIVVRIYIDFQTLRDACAKAGTPDRAGNVDSFARGFCAANKFFDIVNIPRSGTESSARTSELLDLYLHDQHCIHIFLGAPETELHGQDASYGSTRLPREVSVLDPPTLRSMRLDSVFERIEPEPQAASGVPSDDYSIEDGGPPTPPPSMPAISRQLSEISVMDVKTFTPSTLTRKPASDSSTFSSPKDSPSTPAARPVGSKPVCNSWATLAAKPPPVLPTVVAPTLLKATVPTSVEIQRNRRGQRIDAVIRHDKAEVERVKKLKMCNVHYLRGGCDYGDACAHSHKHKPTKDELQTLRLVARMAPCMHGSECEDVKCIYGHVCPAPEGRNGEDCIFGNACRFPIELHKLDRVIVKTRKVTDNVA